MPKGSARTLLGPINYLLLVKGSQISPVFSMRDYMNKSWDFGICEKFTLHNGISAEMRISKKILFWEVK